MRRHGQADSRTTSGRGGLLAAPPAGVGTPALQVAVGLIVAAACLVVYLVTMPPTIVEGDGGELVSAALCLGIPHPTGYPLYMLLAKLFSLAPLSSPAVRVTVLSAVCGAAAAGTIAWGAAALTGSLAAGLLAGVVSGLNRPMWSQATKPEVYALNAVFVALATALFVCWRLHSRPGLAGRSRGGEMVWLALVVGMGLAHHRTSVFATVPLLLAAWITGRDSRPSLTKMALAVGGPLLLYLYLPIRSLAHPAVMWEDLSRWDKLIAHLAGSQYYGYALGRPVAEGLSGGIKIAGDFAAQITLGGTALCVIGLVSLFRRERALAVCLAGSSVLLTVWNLGYDVTDVVDFFVPVWLAAGLLGGEGVAVVAGALRRLWPRRAGWTSAVFSLGVVGILCASLVQRNWSKCDRHNAWRDYDRARAILAQIPEDGIYSPYRDDFVILYLQQVEKYRRDVGVIRPTGHYIAGRPYLAKPPLSDVLAMPVERFLERTGPDTAHEQGALAALDFAKEVAEGLNWARPVYAGVTLPRPPQQASALALWRDLFRMVKHPPQLLAPAPGESVIAELTPALSLQACAVEPSRARPRDLLQIRLDIKCRSEITGPVQVGLRLLPDMPGIEESALRNTLLDYDTWLVYGLLPLPPTLEGQVYRQNITAAVPTNALGGTWGAYLRVGSSATEWKELHRVATFEVVGGAR